MSSSSKAAGSPKVSIVSIAYNQEGYIRQALESFVAQKTSFRFEVVIADDCSTDKTPEIIREYARNYPDIFRATLRKKNLGSWQNFLSVLQDARGDYIALCEGDDYWTDPEKLQKQADFLDNNTDYALCFHPVRVIFDNNEEKETIYPDIKDESKFTVKELLQHNFIQTNSVMYRRQKYENMPANIMPGDLYIQLYHAQFGKIGFIDEVMSVYRRHAGGIWWDSYKNEDALWKKYALPHLALFAAVDKLYGDQAEYRPIIDTAIDNMFNKLIELDRKYGKDLLQQAAHNTPQAAAEFITRQHRQLLDKTKELHDKDQEILKLQHAGDDMEQQITEKDQRISKIQASRVWKARNKVAKIRGREAL
jgi:glycosyltransferase involved in cell wall biosynthesis